MASTALALAALAAVAAPRPAAAQPGSPSGGTDRFVSCLNSGHPGDVLLLFDESQSLRASDAGAARVAAANYLLGRLARSPDTARLDVALGGFSSGYTRHKDWTPLDPGSLAGLQSDVAAFGTRDDGLDTDYYVALEKARQELADRARATGNGDRCQALVWFSDGQLDFAVRDGIRRAYGTQAPPDPPIDITTLAGVDAARARATDLICRGGGVADQMRAAGVTTVGIGLTGAGATDTTFDLMRSITTGTTSGRTCGERLDPVPGRFETAGNIDELLFAFDRVDAGGAVEESVKNICQVADPAQCIEERHRFVLDSSVDEVHILGRADIDGIEVLLIPPTGRVQALNRTPGALSVGGVDARYTWETARTVSVDLAATGGEGWAGEWSLLFVDPSGRSAGQKSHTNIHIEGNLRPALHNAATVALRSGAVGSGLDIGLVRTDGTRVDPATVPGQVVLSAALVTPDGRHMPILQNASKATIGAPSSVDLEGVPAGAGTLEMNLDVTTARPDGTAGTELATQRVSLPLTVQPPPNYPTVAARVDFGVGESTTTLTSAVDVSGPGCVWVDAPADVATGPEGGGRLTVSADAANSPSTCLAVPAGQTATLPLTLRTETVGNGAASGTIPVNTAPLDARDQIQTVPVEFSAELRKPLNVFRFVVALVVALLASLLPVLLLYLIKWFIARIPPGNGLHAESVPVQIVGGRVIRDGEPFVLRPGELRDLAPISGRGARRLVVDGGITLHTRIGWSPFGAPFVTARGPEGTVATSSAHPATHGRRPDARLPLGVHNHWVLVHGPVGPADRATVLLLVGADNVGQADALVRDMCQRVPGLLAQLRERAGQAPGGGPHDGTPAARPGAPVPPVPPGPPQSWPPAAPPSGGTPTAPFPYPRGG